MLHPNKPMPLLFQQLLFFWVKWYFISYLLRLYMYKEFLQSRVIWTLLSTYSRNTPTTSWLNVWQNLDTRLYLTTTSLVLNIINKLQLSVFCRWILIEEIVERNVITEIIWFRSLERSQYFTFYKCHNYAMFVHSLF